MQAKTARLSAGRSCRSFFLTLLGNELEYGSISAGAACVGGAVEVAACIHYQAGVGILSVSAIGWCSKAVQHALGVCTGVVGQLEHDSIIAVGAAIDSGAVEMAVCIHKQAGVRRGSVGARCSRLVAGSE